MPSAQPSILVITSDQQHHSTVGAVNDRIRTPALDRLCREGMRFDRAYCPNPTCTPTRASIVTGMYPSQHGAWSLGTKLFEDVPVIGDNFQEAGYYTALIGKAHFQPLASRPGYESLECQPVLRDLDFWRGFYGPWYGFEHIEVGRMHGYESHAGQHYAIWMEEKGLANWRDYFDPWPPTEDNKRPFYIREERRWTLPEQFHYTRWTGERTIAQIERAAADHRPFFIWSSFHDPHPPYLVPDPWAGMYRPEDMVPGRVTEGEHENNPPHFGLTQQADAELVRGCFAPDTRLHGAMSHLRDPEELRKDMACYYGMVSFMDSEIERILAALDRLGRAENTLVVFASDHGHFLGAHGLIAKAIHHYEDLLRVPLVVRWPGKVPAGQTSGAIQNLVDLPVTFLVAAGLEVPPVMTGVNQLDCWRGGGNARTCTIVENHHGTQKCHMRSYITRRYKITVYRQGQDGELFDLEQDPGEVNNLWRDPASAELKSRLLHEFIQAALRDEQARMPRIAGA